MAMNEAEEKCATITDVDRELFTRLCEYAYRGNYTVPAGTSRAPEVNKDADAESLASRDSFDTSFEGVSTEELGKMFRSQQLTREDANKLMPQERFNERPYSSTTTYKHQLNVGYGAMANTRHDHSFQPVLLGPVKLYLLADKYLVKKRRKLIPYKLRNTLQLFNLYECRVVDIVKLVRLSYSNDYTSDRSDHGELDELRKLVVSHIVIHHSKMD